MNRELELVLMLEPELREPDADEIARQRSRLTQVIEAERMDPPLPMPHRRRGRSIGFRVLVASATVVAVGGGTAFALSSLGPDARQSATVERQQGPAARGIHVPGWRPELDAERVVCDYRNVRAATPLVYTYASEFALTEPLTEQRLVDECRGNTDAVRDAPITAPALLCTATPPGERYPVPAVTFAFSTCSAADLNPAGAGLLDERNRMRRTETAIRAVPNECPTAAQALRWVRDRVSEWSDSLRISPVAEYPGGRCYVPFVHWGRGTVEITALISDPTPSGSGTTPTTAVPTGPVG